MVAAITPWNFPTQINLAKVGPALAAGNTVVLKPAPDTPGWPASSAGWPPSTPTCRPACSTSSPRAPTRSPRVLTTDPRVDLVSFTGSTATGRAIMAAAAPTLKKVFLELGGKSAAIVLDDADLAAAAGADGVRRLHPRRPGLRAHHPAASSRASGTTRRSQVAADDDGVDRRQGPDRPRARSAAR